MDIKQLRYFFAFSQELNFRKAAEKLFLSRQALSKAIHELEKEIGEHLFTENNKKLELTPCGKYLLANSISVIDSFNELEQSMQNWAGKNKIHVQVAIGLGSLNTLPTRLLDDFMRDHPEISLSLEECSDRMVREKVILQQVNLGILSCSPKSIQKFNYCLIQE
jgi:DNA-binding transcriptional LysR family regulator